MSRQENRHSRPGMDLVRDEVSYGVRFFFFNGNISWLVSCSNRFFFQLCDEIQQLQAEKRALEDQLKQTK